MAINHAPHASEKLVARAVAAGIDAKILENSRASHRRDHPLGSTHAPKKVVMLDGIRMSIGQAKQYIAAREK